MKQLFYPGVFDAGRLTDELVAVIPGLGGAHAMMDELVRDDGTTETVSYEEPNLLVWYWPVGAEVEGSPRVGLSIPDTIDVKAVAKVVAAHYPTPDPNPLSRELIADQIEKAKTLPEATKLLADWIRNGGS